MGLSNRVSKLPLGSSQTNLLHQMTTRIRQSLQLQEILQATVTEVCHFLKTDHVMVYQFALDDNTPGDSGDRPVDACYGETLQTGVQAAVVVPILQQDQVWGLLVAHYSEPRTVSEAEVQFLQLVVEQVAIAIAQSGLLSQVQAQVQQEKTVNRIATLLQSEAADPFGAALEAVVKAVSGSGGRLLLLPTQLNLAGELYSYGDQPFHPTLAHSERLEQHSLWQTHGHSEALAIADLYQDARCLALAEVFQSTQIRSLLIIPLQQAQHTIAQHTIAQHTIGYLTLFRNQRETARLWVSAFDPDESRGIGCQAFERRQEQPTQQAQGWTAADLQLVQAIKSHVVTATRHSQWRSQVEALHDRLEQQSQKQTRELTRLLLALDQSSKIASTNALEGTIDGVQGGLLAIGERQQAEEALMLYKRAVDSSSDAIAFADTTGHLFYQNEAHAALYGCETPEIFNQTGGLAACQPDQTVPQAIVQLAITGQSWADEIEQVSRSGRHFSAFARANDIKDEAGNLLGVISVVTDITARKQAEAQLRDQEQFFRAVYEGVEQIIAIIDVLEGDEFCYVGWNPIGEKLAGIPSAAIVGKTPEALFGEANGTALRQNYQRCVNAGMSICYEEYLPFQGQDIWWLTTVNPLKDDKGRINRLVLTATTITERKQAEDALQQKAQQEQLLNQLANQIRSSLDLDEILETAVDSIQGLLNVDRCTFAWYRPHAQPPTWECVYETKPPEFPTILGLYLSDTLGDTAERLHNLEVIRDDDTAASADPHWRQTLLSLGFKSHLSIPMQASSGDIGVLSCSHQRTRRPWKNGEVELLTAVANQLAIALNQADLYKQSRLAAETAQAKAQQLAHALQALQQTQAKLVQTEKMSSLGQLVAGVAHEINNPVNFISGNLNHAAEYSYALLDLLYLYQQHYPQSVPAIQAEADAIDLDFLKEDLPKLLTSMKVGAERIQAIVLALRNFSRMDEAEVKAVNIHDGIDSTLMILQNRIKATAGHPEIQVIKNYSNLPLVECYAGQLNQVFMNILSNAIDALDEYNNQRSLEEQRQQPATLTIQTELAVDRAQGEPSSPHGIHILIADNGLGMAEPVRQRLFEPFFTTKPVGKGTGLGLSISYQVVVDKHGGHLSCLSAPGKGAEFLIELPLVTKGQTSHL